MAFARAQGNPGGDRGQLGTPRPDLDHQPVRPGRRLTAFAVRARVTCFGTTSPLDGLAFDLLEPGVPCAQIAGRRVHEGPEPTPFLAPLLGGQHECIGQPLDHGRPQERLFAFCSSPCLSATRQPNRLPLSTVRQVPRRKRLQRAGVVPVVEVPPVFLHAGQMSRRSARAARPVGRARCNRGRGQPGSRRARGRRWLARSGGRPGRRGPPGNCPEAASGRRRRRRL